MQFASFTCRRHKTLGESTIINNYLKDKLSKLLSILLFILGLRYVESLASIYKEPYSKHTKYTLLWKEAETLFIDDRSFSEWYRTTHYFIIIYFSIWCFAIFCFHLWNTCFLIQACFHPFWKQLILQSLYNYCRWWFITSVQNKRLKDKFRLILIYSKKLFELLLYSFSSMVS